jgi:t-SNARE complex subunit (syntaxin)
MDSRENSTASKDCRYNNGPGRGYRHNTRKNTVTRAAAAASARSSRSRGCCTNFHVVVVVVVLVFVVGHVRVVVAADG